MGSRIKLKLSNKKRTSYEKNKITKEIIDPCSETDTAEDSETETD